jgi:hypothetical protein
MGGFNMGYEINVSLNGTHFFATHERSITTQLSARNTCAIFKVKFPEDEGYKVTVTEWRKTGREIEFAKED